MKNKLSHMQLSKLVLLLGFVAFGPLMKAQSTLALVESSGGCGLVTDCSTNTICFDIMLTPGVTADLQSYNIWVKYPGSGLSYDSDLACITQDGNDNNLDADFSLYRVAGVSGAMQVQAGNPIAIHTICFTYDQLSDINGQTILVGGTVFDVLFSTLTYNNPPSSEPMVPEFPFIMNEESISCLEVLPVQLLSFEARRAGSVAALTWQVAIPYSNGGFDIERSVDGKSFDYIGYVPSGKSQDGKVYTFDDLNPGSGLNHYRLKQTDEDGKYVYSPIRTVLFDQNRFSVVAWPNPATEILNVLVQSAGVSGEIELTMINIAGQILISETIPQETQRKEISLAGIPPGVYQLVAVSGSDRIVEKIIVLDE
jgi:hypothetical protein